MTAPDRQRLRLAGTPIERFGWVLVALLDLVLLVMALTSFGGDDRAEPIDGSGCCNGHVFTAAPAWTFRYLEETFHYQATFQLGMALFGAVTIWFGLQAGRRWAWAVLWYFPVMFAIHSFALGSGLFDEITMSITALGLLLMIRPVFGRPVPRPARATARVEAGQRTADRVG